MKRTLIVATTSYAGMGPYVSEIVNTFSPEDDVYFLLYDYEDNFFQINIKNELKSHCTFWLILVGINLSLCFWGTRSFPILF